MSHLSRQLKASLAANASASPPKLTRRSDPGRLKKQDPQVKTAPKDATGADVMVRRESKANVRHHRPRSSRRTARDRLKETGTPVTTVTTATTATTVKTVTNVTTVTSVTRERLLLLITTTWVVRLLATLGGEAMLLPTPHTQVALVVPTTLLPLIAVVVLPTIPPPLIVASRTIREGASPTKSARATATCQTSVRRSATHTSLSDISSILEEIEVGLPGSAGVVVVVMDNLVLGTSLPLRDPSVPTS